MAYWLIKSEPSTWSWDQQVSAGEEGTFWDGVRNHLAKRHLAAMRLKDRAFFYHSNEGKAIIGVVEVIREAFLDPTAEPGSLWLCVQVKALSPLRRPVTLATVKAEPRLATMALLKYSRLSVQSVTQDEWQIIEELGGS
jgi:predicted RNA-binding protein with PUA-like domain